MSQKERVYKALARGKKISASALARAAKAPYDSVAKRIYDLRNDGLDITTLTVEGQEGASKTTYQMHTNF